MVAQRPADPKSADRPTGQKPQGATPVRSEPRTRKLTFRDKHALETLPGVIEGLENELTVLRGQIADPEFYARDPKSFAAVADRLRQAESELSGAEERWLELEMLREELEAS